jgi:aldose 1-epimerase
VDGLREDGGMTAARTVELAAEGLRLELLTSGAAVRRLVLTDGGAAGGDTGLDVVLGHRDPATYAHDGGYLGATIGRFGNRIARGRFTLDGVTHRLTTNQFGNTLHGGARGFDAHEWAVADEGPRHATFALTSPDGDQGFPGRLEATVTFRVSAHEVRIDYTARTGAPTVVNLTNHAYFQLDGAGSGPVDDHVLEVAADDFLPVRDDLVPTGEVRAVEGTPFDLRDGRRLGEALAGRDEQLAFADGLDHNFVLTGTGMRRVARLTGASGRWLEVHTDQPGLQVYTGAHFDGTATGLHGGTYGPRAGVALETQGFPDAPNHPEFPSTVLRPGETYATSTVWRLGRD